MQQPAKSDDQQFSGTNCSFTSKPDEFLSRAVRAKREVVSRVARLDAFSRTASAAPTVAAKTIPQRNFIDTIIFSQLAAKNVPSAGLSTDEEFLRRVTLDLTGRIPSSADIRAFKADPSTAKRDAMIEQLLYSPEYTDKWTMWLGDLLQNVAVSNNVQPGIGGRDAFYNYLRSAIDQSKSFRDIAYEVVTATGDTSDVLNGGPANYVYHMQTPGGPVQDSYDTMMSRTADAFFGVTYYDCLLCHNGSGHLDSISLWGSTVTRIQAQQMAAHFSRLNYNMPRTSSNIYDGMYNSWRALDKTTGSYDLNTTYGNRPNRVALGTLKTLTPVYLNGAAPAANQNWRDSFAQQMMTDPMFARNFANRMFKAFFNLGLVDPLDNMDPARLDPNSPPASPWTLQAGIPQLLERLAQEAVARNFQFRDFMRVLVQSNAYQLSSRYDAPWDIALVSMYARHYPRRLDAEEVHDAVAKATGVLGNYNVNGGSAPLIQWAMQLPDPLAPSGGGATLLNAFLRGNRDSAARSSDASVIQRLTIMNDNFVISRVKMAASPELQEVAKITDNTALVNEVFLTFLSRMPTAAELASATKYLTAATTTAARNSAIEDLSWALINKIDFLYSY
ncbi:MAG: hypothetical protein JWO80_4497 [Bryobacterales bacterium]|nr:hypothetical protein [Bryobacterales bacterium]